MNDYDCLITDFSSLIFDFALLDKSIYFLPLDMENYLSGDCQLYVDYDSFTNGYRISGWQDFISQLTPMTKNIRAGTTGSPHSVKGYSVAYQDGKNSERVFNGIMDRLH